MSDLAKRAVACKHWRWAPWMRTYSPYFHVYYRIAANRPECSLVLDGTGDGAPVVQYRDMHDRAKEPLGVCNATPLFDTVADMLPDLTDPATLGCLLALVREAWCERTIGIEWENGTAAGWLVTGIEHNEISGDTEAEALVAALEVAP